MGRYIPPTYDFSVAEQASTVAAKNFISLHNPAGSGRLIVPSGVFVSYSNTVQSSVTAPMRGYRCNNASGGTLQPDSAVAKFSTSNPDPVAELRVVPTGATLGAAIFNSPTGLDKRGSDVQQIDIPPGASPFVLAPGEGIILRQEAGVVGLFWNLSIVWVETGL